MLKTLSIVSGICTGLNPNFNFWESMMPYASKLLAEDGDSRFDIFLSEAGAILQTLIALPRQVDSVLGKLERDELGVRVPQLETRLTGLELSVRRIIYALIFMAFLISAVQLQLGGELLFARLFYAGAAVVLLGLLLARPKKG